MSPKVIASKSDCETPSGRFNDDFWLAALSLLASAVWSVLFDPSPSALQEFPQIPWLDNTEISEIFLSTSAFKAA